MALYSPLALPLVALLAVAVQLGADCLREWRALQPAQAPVELILPATQLLHELQLERGHTEFAHLPEAGGSGASPEARAALHDQRRRVDAALAEFVRAAGGLSEGGSAPPGGLPRVLTVLDGIPPLRKAVDTGQLASPRGRLEAYTELTSSLLGLLEGWPVQDPATLASLADLHATLSLQEATGLERATGLWLLGSPPPSDALRLYVSAHSRTTAARQRLEASAERLPAEINDALHRSAAHGEVEALQDRLWKGTTRPTDAVEWFATHSSYVSQIDRASRSLRAELVESLRGSRRRVQRKGVLLCLALLGLGGITLWAVGGVVRPLLTFAETMERVAGSSGRGGLEPTRGPTEPILGQLERTAAEVVALSERFGIACDAARLGIWEWRVPEDQLVWDQQMYSLYGVDPEAFGGAYATWRSGVHPDDQERGDEEVQAALRGEREFSTRFRVVWPSGEVRMIQAAAVVLRDDEGAPSRMIGVNMDVTEEWEAKRALEELTTELDARIEEQTAALRARSDELRAILDHTRDAVLSTDRDLVIVRANAASEQTFGWPRDALRGRTLASLVHPLPDLAEDGEPLAGLEVTGTRPDGSGFPAALDVQGFEVAGERRWVASIRDVTAQRELTAALIAAKEAAEEASQTKSRFVANISHEIRTPMSAILGMAELTLATPLNGRQRHYLEALHSSAKALLALLGDILDVSKIEAGALEIEQIGFDLETDLLAEIGRVAGFQAQEKGVELVLDVEPTLPASLRGDPLRVRQILLNLLSNAVKFSEEGSDVLLSVRLLRWEEGKALVRFVVRDRGIGMTPDDLARVGQPFRQADASTTRVHGGTGLGLSISRQLVALQGGTLEIESARGEGTSVTVDLPFTAPPGPTLVEARRDHAGTLEVLLVVDGSATQEALANLLQGLGHGVLLAASGAEAIQMASSGALGSTDAIVLDWARPPVDALGTLRHIEAVLDDACPPFVLLSHPQEADEARRATSGTATVAFLSKPVSPSDLQDALVDVCTDANGSLVSVTPVDAQRAPPDLTGHRLLVVEDHPINQLVITEVLKPTGAAVLVESNGLEAVGRAVSERWSAILMDCQMPGVDGYEATRRIRAEGIEVPIIAVSANVMSEDRARALAAGMDEHLAKPVDVTRLYELLASLSGRTGAGPPSTPPRPGRPTSRSPPSRASIPTAPLPRPREIGTATCTCSGSCRRCTERTRSDYAPRRRRRMCARSPTASWASPRTSERRSWSGRAGPSRTRPGPPRPARSSTRTSRRSPPSCPACSARSPPP